MTARIIATILGLFFGGLPGAIIGFLIGSFLDQAVQKTGGSTGRFQWRQSFTRPFIRSVFILMGYLAKADGQVTSSEINIASLTMTQLRLSDDMRHQAMRWFYEGKNHQFAMNEIFQTVSLYRHTPLVRVLFTCLNNMAHANGLPSAAQQQILRDIAERLGIVMTESQQRHHYYNYNNTTTSSYTNSLSDDYALLGLASDADVATIRKTYRRLMNKYHPDKLASKGASEQDIKAANEKIYTIRRAYENVMHSKGENV